MFAIWKRIGIMGIIYSRIGIIFIRIRGQNYFHYSHSFQNNHNKLFFSLLHFIKNKLVQFVFAIRKRIGIIGIISSRIGIIFILIRCPYGASVFSIMRTKIFRKPARPSPLFRPSPAPFCPFQLPVSLQRGPRCVPVAVPLHCSCGPVALQWRPRCNATRPPLRASFVCFAPFLVILSY